MKMMDRFCRFIAILLLVSFISCASAPYTINGVSITDRAQSPQLRLLQSGGTKRSSTKANQQQPQQTQTAAQPASPYWTGDGGRGKSITILPPRGSRLAENQAYLPDFVANELVSNFNTFSAMTLFDRVSNQRQYDELLSGYYADDDKAGLDLGHLTSTDYMLLGDITKTSVGYTLQLTVNKNSDKTTVAAYSGTVSIAELDNLTGVRRASLDLLQKMGVQLTAQAKTELTKAPTTDQLSALTAMAQGIIAQRQGSDTSVAALTYFMQAAAFDASLAEAVSRTNVVSANISTGNIGANVRNDFAWSDSWKAKLTETETFINDMLRNTSPQRSIWYSDNVWEQESARDHVKRTTELRIEAVLHTHAVFPVSMQRAVQAVYDGLQSTKRAQAWKLDGWPRQGVTNANPFSRTWGAMIPIVFEVLNEKGQVIGRQTVEMDSRYSFNGTRLEGPGTAFATVRFTGVKGDDITDSLSIRIASINGNPPEKAGISQIAPMSAWQMAANKNFTIYNGVLRPSSNNRDLFIPAELWGERVTVIPSGAFENRGLTGVTISEGITSIGENMFANNQLSFLTIPNSVTTIGASAFANNKLTSVTIPSGVTTIGDKAFADNRLESVTIPSGVTTIGDKAFADNLWTTDVRNSSYYHGLTRVTIASSVTSIGQEAFASHWTTYDSTGYPIAHRLPTEVTIGANVNIGKNAFGDGFEAFYAKKGRQAGIYRADGSAVYGYNRESRWKRFDNINEAVQNDAKREKASNFFGILAWVGIGGLIIGGIIYGVLNPIDEE